jgi:hypothetical protein
MAAAQSMKMAGQILVGLRGNTSSSFVDTRKYFAQNGFELC